MTDIPIRRALISVSDKSGLVDLGKRLVTGGPNTLYWGIGCSASRGRCGGNGRRGIHWISGNYGWPGQNSAS